MWGVHQDGLVHISQMADRFVQNPADVVKVHQKVSVTVLDVDLERNRIALSMKSAPDIGGNAAGAGSGKTPAGARKKKASPRGGKPERSAPKPFNNPFAEAFGKKR